MGTDGLPTKFLPAGKAGPAELERQRGLFTADSPLVRALDGMLNFTLLLNLQRQAVFVNKAFRDFLAGHGVAGPLEERPGWLTGCAHAGETPGGCGTAEACRYCGAANTLAAVLEGKEAVNECRILAGNGGEALDLRVRARPFDYNGEKFILMALADISAEKRRQALEKLFFHDVLNTAGGVQGLIALIGDCDPREVGDYVPAAMRAADRLVELLTFQKDLAAAERGELRPEAAALASLPFLRELAGRSGALEAARDLAVKVAGDAEGVTVNTDGRLLAMVLRSFIKNALEAALAGEVITLSCRATADGAAFTVHNPGLMPESSRAQVFQRSFSTKGDGRGLGAYGARLIAEKYLKGKVSFTSGPAGTEFRVELPRSL